MFKKSFRYIFMTLFLIINFFIISSVQADNNYGTIDARIAQNEKMLSASNNLSSLSRERYSDKYLKDLAETNYKGINTIQQQKIQNFADATIL